MKGHTVALRMGQKAIPPLACCDGNESSGVCNPRGHKVKKEIPNYMSSGESVKEIRERLGLTQSELARLTAYSPSAIARYEIGNRNPSRRFLRRLADVDRTVSQTGHPETLSLGDPRNAGTVVLRLAAIESRLGRLESMVGQVLDLLSQRNT